MQHTDAEERQRRRDFWASDPPWLLIEFERRLLADYDDLEAGIAVNKARLEAAGELAKALEQMREAAHHDCGATEGEHLIEHQGPATLAARAALKAWEEAG